MNPDTNRFETLIKGINDALEINAENRLLRPNGKPVPKHWSIFTTGENVIVKDYTFKVAHIGETYLVLEPVGPIIIGEVK